jgi:hypothetical protein
MFPPPSGEVIVRLAGGTRRIAPGDHVTLPATAGPIEVAVEVIDFVGELQLRLWDEATIAGAAGARHFWLPAWTADEGL